MKILLTADPIGGVWNYALELSQALRSAHAHFVLATLGRPLSAAQRAQAAARDNITLCESTFRLEWMQDPWEDVEAAGPWLLELERQFRPDIVHLNHLVHADLPWRAPVVSVGHSCVLSWWAAVRGGRAGAEWRSYERKVRASLQAARLVVAPSDAMLTELERFYGPFGASTVIYNARSGALFAPARKEVLVLCAGRLWDEAKNVAALAAVASRVDAPVVIAGDAVGLAGNARPLPGVFPLGHLEPDSLSSWYARAAIYALPARYEPFGLTVLEAALSGCALVLGDIQTLRELWGDAALYVPPEDHASLRDTLNELIRNEVLRARMAARARKRAGLFTPARLARQYCDLYRWLQCDSPCSITP